VLLLALLALVVGAVWLAIAAVRGLYHLVSGP
jgi:hypothetical protein